MKKNKKLLFKTICMIVTIFTMTFSTNLNAQGPPDGGTDVDDTTPSNSIPLDGGLVALLIGAAAFGIKKLRNE